MWSRQIGLAGKGGKVDVGGWCFDLVCEVCGIPPPLPYPHNSHMPMTCMINSTPLPPVSTASWAGRAQLCAHTSDAYRTAVVSWSPSLTRTVGSKDVAKVSVVPTLLNPTILTAERYTGKQEGGTRLSQPCQNTAARLLGETFFLHHFCQVFTSFSRPSSLTKCILRKPTRLPADKILGT